MRLFHAKKHLFLSNAGQVGLFTSRISQRFRVKSGGKSISSDEENVASWCDTELHPKLYFPRDGRSNFLLLSSYLAIDLKSKQHSDVLFLGSMINRCLLRGHLKGPEIM